MRSVEIRLYRLLMFSLVVSIAAHGLALLAMVALLGPGLDTAATVVERAQYVAESSALWRLGWLPWQITAASDILVSGALVAYLAATSDRRGISAAVFALIATVIAVIPDQWGEAVSVGSQIDQAREVAAGDLAPAAYLKTEAWVLLMTGTCGAGGYTLMSLGWLMAAAQSAGGLRRHVPFVATGSLTLVLFTVTVVANWYATRGATVEAGYPMFSVVYGFNAVAFPLLLLLMVWMGVVLGRGHHDRHPGSDAALHRLSWPSGAAMGWLARVLVRPGLRDMARIAAPMPTLVSDIRDVVYLNWLVPTDRVAAMLPEPLRAHDLGGQTWVSLLTYNHGAVGPRLLGPLRALMPSPPQSNWRFYVDPEVEDAPRDGIYFFKTVLFHPLLTIGSRVISDGLPAHMPADMWHRRDGDRIATRIDPGDGSAPDLNVEIEEHDTRPDAWDETIRYLIEQNRAVGVVAAHDRVLESRISIPIDLKQVRPARVLRFESTFLKSIVDGCECLAFVVPTVAFEARGDRWTRRISTQDER